VRTTVDHPAYAQARKLGYVPQDQRPEVIVALDTAQARLDELIAAGYRPVIDEVFERNLGRLPDWPRIETDPITGVREYRGSMQRYAAAGLSLSVPSGGPPSVMEQPPIFQSNAVIAIDRFALNPGRDFFEQAMSGAAFAGPAPTMFLSGDLPPLTGSGADPSILRWVPWYVRHSAALAGSAAQLLLIIEETYDGSPDFQQVQSVEGQDHLQGYLSRISGWVQTSPQETPDDTQELEDYIARTYFAPQPD
jgi:hypothetical protein